MVVCAAYRAEKCGAVSFETTNLLVRPYRFSEQRGQILTELLIILSQYLLVLVLIGCYQFAVYL